MIKDKALIDKLVEQSIKEHTHGLAYRQNRHPKWEKTDELYFLKKKKSLVSRANIHLPILHGAIETLLSKTDTPPVINFKPTAPADRPKAADANSLLKIDADLNDWDSIDLYGKKEAYLYGRCIEKKYSYTDEDGFHDVRELVPSIDFVIDPLCGGLDPHRTARFQGQDNIIRTKEELKDADIYDQEAVEELASTIRSDGQADDRYRSHASRKYAQGLSQFAYVSDDAMNLTEWYTICEGKKYYLLFSIYGKKAVRVEELKDVFENNESPFSSWAAFAVKDEYWSPAPAELFHDINYAQNVLTSQLLDNSAFRNYGMTAFDKSKIPNPAQLDPRPQGRIAVNGKPQDALMAIQFPSIGENIQLMNFLSIRFDTDTGITQQAKGAPNTKRMSATEFNGLIEQVQDRVLTYNKQYTAHYKRLGRLYLDGLKENLDTKRRVEVLGAGGITNNFISKKDLDFQSDIIVEVSLDDSAETQKQKEDTLAFIANNRENQRMNQRFLDEKEAHIMGFTDDEIARLMNPQLEGSWRVVSEAHKENERLLTSNEEPNMAASTAHVQTHLDFLRETSDLTDSQRRRILKHAEAEVPIAEANAQLSVSKMLNAQIQTQIQNVAAPPPAPSPEAAMPMAPPPPAI